MSFIGQFTAKLDSKNRVFLPATFRRPIQAVAAGNDAESEVKTPEVTLVLRRDLFENCLVIYPESQWRNEIEKVRSRLNRFDSFQQMVYRKFVSEAQEVTLDSSGRFLLPKGLLEKVGIGQDVLFVGMEQTIEMWAPSVAGAGGGGEPFMSDADFAEGIRNFMTE